MMVPAKAYSTHGLHHISHPITYIMHFMFAISSSQKERIKHIASFVQLYEVSDNVDRGKHSNCSLFCHIHNMQFMIHEVQINYDLSFFKILSKSN